MALLNSLPPYPNTLAYRCAVDKSWFMSPSLWTRHVVTSTITDTGKFSNDLIYRCLLFLQEIDVLKVDPLLCRACNQNYSPLVESTIERKRKCGPDRTRTELPTTSVYFRSSQKNQRDKEGRCSTCFGRKASLFENTNFSLIRDPQLSFTSTL